MQKVTFINARGDSIEIGYQKPFFLNKIEGLGDVDADIQLQKAPFQHGSTCTGIVLSERQITLEVAILSNDKENRQILSRVFNPLLGEGRFIYENGIVKREIKAIPDHVPKLSDERPRLSQKVLIDLICPSPFWEDINPQVFKLEDFVGAFTFPFHFPVSFSSRGDGKTLLNTGDVPTPIKVEFRGPVVNPKITNTTTGEFIKINQTIPEGYKLIIDTSSGNKGADIVAPDGVVTNGLHYMDLNSDFFDLDVGETRFSFITDGGSPEVYVHYKNRYLSV